MAAAPPPGALYRLYAAATALGQPLIHAYAMRRSAREGVAPDRIAERRGIPGVARPDGRLVWFHAVSVGEALSILGLIEEMAERAPDLSFLITTVSATSARLVADRAPPRVLHQFAPVDTPGAVARFLGHWRPDLAVFVESELWPRQITAIADRGIPLALVNARLSARSRVRWEKRRELARAIFGRFDTVIAQTADTAAALEGLGARALAVSGDLKAASARLPVPDDALAAVRGGVGDRPLWVAASTHPGEEEIVAAAHDPGRLLILAPRHPDRGDAVAAALRDAGWRVSQRGKDEPLGRETQIYLADTLGEMGLWYALSEVVFLGGSLKPVGGHNPFEPAQFGCAVLTGPHVTNFRETYDGMIARGAARVVRDAAELAAALAALDDPAARGAMQVAARAFVEDREAVRTTVADRLIPLLDRRP